MSRIDPSPSGAPIQGTASGQILVWNNTTKEWAVQEPESGGAQVFGSRATGILELPFSGPFSAPTGFEITVPTVPAGGTLLVEATVHLQDTGSQGRNINVQLLADLDVLDTFEGMVLPADGNIMLSAMSLITYVAEQNDVVVSVGYNSSGAGTNLTGGCMSVTVIPPL